MQNIEEIYKNYFETVNKYLFCLTRDNDISEELTQETFYKAVEKIDTYDEKKGKMLVWLCQIAKNLWFNQYKKNKRMIRLDDNDLLNIPELMTTESIIISKEEKSDLYKKIQQLNEMSIKVIYLRITGELSFKEIGNILNQTEEWARVTFYRAKQKLKEGEKNERKQRL